MVDAMFNKINRFIPEKWQWVLNHGGFRRYFKNTGWMFLGQVISLVLSFFIGAWIARYLGPENYGVLSYSIAFAGLFAFIASLGVDGIVSRELVTEPEKKDELLGTAFVLKLIGGFLASAITIASIFILETSPLIRALVSLFSLTYIFQATQVISLFFQSRVEAKNNFRAQFFASIVSSVFKVLFLLLGWRIEILALIYALDLFWMGLGLVFSYKLRGNKFHLWSLNLLLLKRMVFKSLPLMLSAAFIYIYSRIDQVLVGAILEKTMVGFYAAAVKLFEIWGFIPLVLCGSLFPALVLSRNSNKDEYKKRLKTFFIFLIFLATTISFLSFLFSKEIVLFLFGSEYLVSSSILRIYIWSLIGLFINSFVNNHLLINKKHKEILFYNFILMLIAVILNLAFILNFGVFGAAWGTLLAYSVVPVGVSIFIFKKYE